MKETIRRKAAVLLILYAAALGVGGVAYQLRPGAGGAQASPASRLVALESLRGGLSGADTVAYRLCRLRASMDGQDSSVVLAHYYLAQYALAPVLVDTTTREPAHVFAITDVPPSCEAVHDPSASSRGSALAAPSVVRLDTSPR